MCSADLEKITTLTNKDKIMSKEQNLENTDKALHIAGVSGSYCIAKHEDGRIGKWYFKHKQIGEIIPVCFDDDMRPTYIHKAKLGWGNP